MVKIRLRRIGTKGRPFYRVVVAPSMAGRNGRFVENIGTYDPTVKPTRVQINEERAMHWLLNGAQPTETTAYLLNKLGILPKYLEQRPDKKKDYKYLDKTTASISKQSAVDVPAAKAEAEKPAPAPEPEAAAAPEPAVEEAQPEAAPAPAPEPEAEAAPVEEQA
ncbi:MAG: small subunit ribosomal protein [Fimbriimonadaceae bacterium]|jgi:small subunit ribosomal protein S16|nr:small subunit ribosomal protein [Fimbriimonadaceae bacterium]